MSKNYSDISNQVACIQTSSHTFSIYGSMEKEPIERFGELVNGKFKFLINDFKNGKGDNSISAYYNLDIKHIKYLYQRAKLLNLPVPFTEHKIHGAYPITEGKYAGLCKAFKIEIKHTPIRQDGSISRNPWNITITNGVAKAKDKGNNVYIQEENTFQQTAYAYINLSDIDFLDCMDRAYSYMENFRFIAARELIPQGLKKLYEVRSRGEYRTAMQEAYQKSSQDERMSSTQKTNTVQEPVQEIQGNQVPNVISGPSSLPQLHPTNLLIQSKFQALENGQAIAQCVAKGKTYTIWFDQVTEDMIDAQVKQLPITVNLYMDNQRRCHCYNTVAC